MDNVRRLLDIMAQLRDPETGCPWDLKQDFASLVPYTLEEAYEVADAIEREDFHDLRGELGDLLLQVVFHAQIGKERGLFDFEAVAGAIADKLIRRHPHVFDAVEFESDAERLHFWENSKREEHQDKTGEPPESLLSGVAPTLPALMRAQKLQKRAARVGFDWPEIEGVFAKVEEELAETRAAHESGDVKHIEEEVGDLLFVAVNLARHLGVDAEAALSASSRKFTRRFRYIEDHLAQKGRRLDESDLAELDTLWDEAKRQERA
ncbi:nucleoside triphosphate pyrophosphohydrolase [Methylococcus sp. EFPC2]|uniref:nucleoside triphosphate pyrophosphohydrolase n=1 Tax=Methylococcus sp. EFPC2 TaxID=2812648 RepID=UPI0019680E01|nr:nucleoside triphosphate pyrophosphohydrolase [Methylococcus sp. EFPC2]QSA96215.1 nucleoside triphosphate pyrophosphohydrolase [Methylococcus sp. EFPC2]